MELKSEVGIVSAFGRGHWLAARLAEAQVPVALLDISSQMGDWNPRDIEGPFGFFEVKDDLSRSRLFDTENVIQLPRGLTLWLSSGPLELRGPTTDYRMKQLGLKGQNRTYLESESQGAEILKGLKFTETWISHWAHAFSSSVETLSPEAYKEGIKRKLFSDFHFRQASPAGHENSLKWCEKRGVKVIRSVQLLDLAFSEKKNLDQLEIRQDKPGLFKAEQYVFCLSSEEASFLGAKIQNAIFGSRVLEPLWDWMRFEVRLRGLDERSAISLSMIPDHCVLIMDEMLPWTHENQIVLQRAGGLDFFDAWMKIPHSQRFHSQYLAERASQMKTLLESRIPAHTLEILRLPAESHSTFLQLGAPRHPVFARSSQRKKYRQGTVFFDSPECWKSLGVEGPMAHGELIFNDLKTWWDRKEELRKKREAKEHAKKRNQGAEL